MVADVDMLNWIIGTGLSVIAIIGGIIARDRQLTRLISEGDDKLHDRINRVRDDYVRRVDLDGQIARLDKNVDELRDEIRQSRNETNQRLDAIIAAVAKRPE